MGQNKIITNSNGISLRCGGISAGDNVVTVGEIGATNTSDSHFYINGNGVNNISINSGIGATNLVTNMVWIGSGTANANGRKSNINMLDASGNWETQSSAFTETLKAQITSSSSNYTTINAKFTDASTFWVRGKNKNAIVSNSTIGLTDPLPASSSFNNTSDYPSYFNASSYFFQTGLSSLFGNTASRLSIPE